MFLSKTLGDFWVGCLSNGASVFSARYFCSFLNATHLVLIPKKTKPKVMQELRAIDLCNILYKVISKVVANRLREVLFTIISEN